MKRLITKSIGFGLNIWSLAAPQQAVKATID